jgi:hypothetical protein
MRLRMGGVGPPEGRSYFKNKLFPFQDEPKFLSVRKIMHDPEWLV